MIIFVLFELSACYHKCEKKDYSTVEKQKLKILFANWQKNEIVQGHLWSSDSCYPGWFVEHNYYETIGETWGLPSDTSEYTFSYADIDNDGQLDQLVTFTPSQCDGGNASMWTQIEVLTVSDSGNYKTNASIGDGLFASMGKDTIGFYWYDSIGTNKIYGTYYSFLEEDGHCCPSIRKPVVFSYDKEKVKMTEF